MADQRSKSAGPEHELVEKELNLAAPQIDEVNERYARWAESQERIDAEIAAFTLGYLTHRLEVLQARLTRRLGALALQGEDERRLEGQYKRLQDIARKVAEARQALSGEAPLPERATPDEKETEEQLHEYYSNEEVLGRSPGRRLAQLLADHPGQVFTRTQAGQIIFSDKKPNKNIRVGRIMERLEEGLEYSARQVLEEAGLVLQKGERQEYQNSEMTTKAPKRQSTIYRALPPDEADELTQTRGEIEGQPYTDKWVATIELGAD